MMRPRWSADAISLRLLRFVATGNQQLINIRLRQFF